MGQNSNNQFSTFKPNGTPVVMIQEWTAFQNILNQKLNGLFNISTWGNATMLAGTVSIPIPGVTQNSNAQATMQIGGTQTGFLQVKCTLNTLTVTSTVNTDTGTILYLVNF